MATGQELGTEKFPRRSTRGVMLGFSGPRVVVLLAGVVGLVAGLLHEDVELIVVAPLLALVFAYVSIGGRYLAEWTPVIVQWVIRKNTSQTRYRARITSPRPVGTLALPGDGGSLRYYEEPDSGVCMFHDPHRHTLSATLKVTHPAYMLLAPDEKNRRVSMWGRAIASLSQSERYAGLQLLESTIPDSGRGLEDFYVEHGDPEAGWAGEQYRQVLANNSASASTHLTTVTLGLDMAKAAADVKAQGRGVRGAAKVLLADMRALQYVLRNADLQADHWLDERECAQIIRRAFDPSVGGGFTPESPGADLAHAGPLAVDEMWDRIHHDSGWSRVLWISDLPRTAVQADFLHSLIFESVRKTFCLSMRPKTARKALRDIRREKGDWQADQAQKRKSGRVEELSDDEEYRDVEARELAIGVGHADVDFTGFLTITTDSEEELLEATNRIERAAGTSGAEVRVVWGSQFQAFLVAALPLGRMTF